MKPRGRDKKKRKKRKTKPASDEVLTIHEHILYYGDAGGFEPGAPAAPVSYRQGTIEKLKAMRLRAERGQELHVEGDENARD